MNEIKIIDLCITFVPSMLVGTLIGISSYLRKSNSGEIASKIKDFFASALTCATLSIAGYGLSAHFTSNELVQIGIASMFAIVGVDRIVKVAEQYVEHKLK